MAERERRTAMLTPEQERQIFPEASRKNTTDAEVCRRWGIAPHQLRVIRERAKESSLKGFSRGPPTLDRPADHRAAGRAGAHHRRDA